MERDWINIVNIPLIGLFQKKKLRRSRTGSLRDHDLAIVVYKTRTKVESGG